MKLLLKASLLTVAVTLSCSAQAALGQGEQKISRGKCKAATCTISGASATINVKEKGKTTKYVVVTDACQSIGFTSKGVGDIADFCARGGYSRQKTTTTEVWAVNRHSWSYTYKKGDSITVKSNGTNTWAKIDSPSTRGHEPRPWR